MIEKEKVKEVLLNEIDREKIVLVDIEVNRGNAIKVILDSLSGITIDECAKVSKLIESHFDREIEDYELEVSSYSISQAFILPLHYQKNLNKQIEVYLKDGKSIKGILKLVDSDEFTGELERIELAVTKKVQLEGKKRKIEVEEIIKLAGAEIQKAKLLEIF